MRIAAVSDFHMGARDSTCEFGHQPAAFARFLDQLERDHQLIVLVGDVFQTEHGPRIGKRCAAKQLQLARQRMGALAERLLEPPYVYLFGNHDEIAASECGAQAQLNIDQDGLHLIFMHGHQFDPLLNHVAPLAKTGTWVGGRVRALGRHGLFEQLERFEGAVYRVVNGQRGNARYLQAGRRLCAERNADLVVMGHTHRELCERYPEGTVANSGSCSGGRFVNLSIDTAERRLTLRDGERPRESFEL